MHKQALADLLDLLAVRGPSGEEKPVADRIVETCRTIPGFKGLVETDAIGNLFIRFDGPSAGPRLMFSAHLDTIPLALGARPVIRDGMVLNDVPHKSLGADCRAGCAILLQLIRRVAGNPRTYPPLTFVFFAQEEIGVLGSLNVDLPLLGRPGPAMAFDFDSEGVRQIYNGCIGADRLHIDIQAKGAHTCLDPENGISAVVIQSLALADLVKNGWHGVIDRPDGKGLANLGIIRGGEATNCVMPDLYAYAEMRAKDRTFRNRIGQAWKEAFEKAAAGVKNAKGECGKVSFRLGPCYESFEFPKDSPVVQRALKAAAKAGVTPEILLGNGGGDANRIAEHGIPCVALGMGVHSCHTPEEHVSLEEFGQSCDLALALLEGA